MLNIYHYSGEIERDHHTSHGLHLNKRETLDCRKCSEGNQELTLSTSDKPTHSSTMESQQGKYNPADQPNYIYQDMRRHGTPKP